MPRPRALMIQGTGSDVGKSLLVAAIARAYSNRGLVVRPFKPQNMSNNAAVTPDGGEIGRAQALQARACRVLPSVHMNPVLLKPQSDIGAQVIVQGRMIGTSRAADYQTRKGELLAAVLDSFARIGQGADLVLVEGAGSPAEINLRTRDIANMGFARAAGVPVILAGDIDRGGVIASIVGTHNVVDADDRAMIRGYLINKFRGDIRLFDEGLVEITRRTGWPSFGVLPFQPAASRLPAEDAVALDNWRGGQGALRIAVPMLSRIANFDDFDPLRLEPGVAVTMVPPGKPLPGDADLVILPGSKATIADLAFLRAQGWDIDLHAHIRRGGRVLGICGGYQMLGTRISDPDGIEGPPASVAGLGWLDVETVLTGSKTLTAVTGCAVDGDIPFTGYEMHVGITSGPGRDRPMLYLNGPTGPAGEGAIAPDGRIAGCYIHGLFGHDAFRRHFLSGFGAGSDLAYDATVDAALDELAAACERHLDLDGLLRCAG
ncbi:cobyric acid synthase [Niveispirillum sp. BGYR6]|uniref:cobyric acid synthase n=1 Tax=Niveispirillum sp. BGYR6 TaxID=2971249 RepID=UPI0022B9C6BB|nr:cobyric acid synthase [Niveispirillum sp. BGYR6]MDG5496082.1 cobyric acid synthase [Niveispirillum sp. BGYR6]